MAKKAFGKKEFNYSEVSRELKKDGPQRLYLLHGCLLYTSRCV